MAGTQVPDWEALKNTILTAIYGKDVRAALAALASGVEYAIDHQITEIDKTLTQSDAGADAKVVGDALQEIDDTIDDVTNAIVGKSGSDISGWENGKNISATGAIGSSSTFSANPTYIKLPDYAASVIYKTTTSSSYVALYSEANQDSFIERIQLGTNATTTISTATAKYMRISVAGAESQNTGTVSWTWKYPLASKANNAATLSWEESVQIMASAENPIDYDDFKAPGNYVCGNGSYIQYIAHAPNIGASHRLFVLSTTNASRIVQVVVTNAIKPAVEIYKRIFNGTAWSDWNKIVEDGKKCDALYTPADFEIMPQGIYYAGTDDTYNSFSYDSLASDVITAFDALVTIDGSYIAKTDLGVCSDGTQHVYAYDFNPTQIGRNQHFGNPIPCVFIVCGQHGYEKASVYALYYMLKHMMTDSYDYPVLDYLRNHCRILCVPIANPYGFNNKTYKNATGVTEQHPDYGVNLNRNWDVNWVDDEPETSKDYAGTAAFSEPETAAIRDLFLSNKAGITFAFDYHTNGKANTLEWYDHNDILTNDDDKPLQNAFKRGIRYHVKSISTHLSHEYSLGLSDETMMGRIMTSVAHGGRAGEWFATQNKLGCTFEGFPAFRGGSLYTADVIKANEEVLASFIINVLNGLR